MVRVIIYFLLVLLCVACGDSPTAPSVNNVPCAPTYHRVYAADGIGFTCQPN